MNNNERIRQLQLAEKELKDIADRVEDILRMSGHGIRFGDIPERIREIASAKDTNSISNLRKELEYIDEEQPGWTRPLASVKNVNRKDI